MFAVSVRKKMKKIFKKEESAEILKIFGLLRIYNYFKNMVEENISKKFELKNINETRDYYYVEEIEQN